MLIRTDAKMRAVGKRIINACESGGVIALQGDLGTGKTTLVRGALQSLQVVGGIRSPTYTLVEIYPLEPLSIAHFDLYRLGDGEELEYLGFRDYLNSDTVCLIEWPEKARGYLDNIGLTIELSYHEKGRYCELRPVNDWGQRIVDRFVRQSKSRKSG
ncbi:MAG: tRNA threonylcarbamoyladenosine biosynthesis protein TsaE [Gammaproteobacteria bacterium]|jgi:tRNA threonylcarbamoyladenosine biosynthesis protein TsaE